MDLDNAITKALAQAAAGGDDDDDELDSSGDEDEESPPSASKSMQACTALSCHLRRLMSRLAWLEINISTLCHVIEVL